MQSHHESKINIYLKCRLSVRINDRRQVVTLSMVRWFPDLNLRCAISWQTRHGNWASQIHQWLNPGPEYICYIYCSQEFPVESVFAWMK